MIEVAFRTLGVLPCGVSFNVIQFTFKKRRNLRFSAAYRSLSMGLRRSPTESEHPETESKPPILISLNQVTTMQEEEFITAKFELFKIKVSFLKSKCSLKLYIIQN
jgi:hypothetical protein